LDTSTDLHGNYHLQATSTARNAGLVGTPTTGLTGAIAGMNTADANAGRKDIDGDVRGGMGYAGNPATAGAGTRPDIGMDEVR
jgi:hypothetical protein